MPRQKAIRRTTKGKRANYRPTKSGAGMTKRGVAAHRRANPGSKLKTAVTGKVKKGSKAAKRRKSYCARSLGQLKRSSAKTRNAQKVRLGQNVLLIHILLHMQIWQHQSIVKILTMQKSLKQRK